MKIVLYIAAGLILLSFLNHLLMRRRVRRAARRIREQIDDLYTGKHEYAKVDARSFRYLDLRFYDETAELLRSNGFRELGDFEDLTASATFPSMRTFIRSLISKDGLITAGIYHVKARGLMAPLQWFGVIPRRMQIVDLESELNDGQFLTTSNVGDMIATPPTPGIDSLHQPVDTPIDEIISTHRERMASFLEENPDACFRIMRSAQDVLASQDRMTALKAAHHRRVDVAATTLEALSSDTEAERELLAEVRRTHHSDEPDEEAKGDARPH